MIVRNRWLRVCSPMPSRATRMPMPARTITASWVVKSSTFFIVGLAELSSLSFCTSPERDSAEIGEIDMTSLPWARSVAAAAAAVEARWSCRSPLELGLKDLTGVGERLSQRSHQGFGFLQLSLATEIFKLTT